MKKYFFLHDPSQSLLMRTADALLPGAKWAFWAQLDGGGNLLDGGVWWSDVARVTYFYPLSPNYETFLSISVPTYSQGQVLAADASN